MNKPYPPHTPQQAIAQSVARLPSTARAKYQRLCAQADDAETLARACQARRVTIEDRYASTARRASYIDQRADPQGAEALRLELEQARVELEQVETDLRHRNDAVRAAQQVVIRVQDFLAVHMIGPVRAAAVTAEPRKNEDVRAAIARVRTQLATAQNEVTQVKSVPPTQQEIRDQLRQEVQRLMDAGTPHWSYDQGRINVQWPDASPYGSPASVLTAPAGSASALVAALFPDQMFALLTRGLDDMPGLSATERAHRIDELTQQISQLELQEEGLVEQAVAQGIEVFRRGSASPWAVLGIEQSWEAQAAE